MVFLNETELNIYLDNLLNKCIILLMWLKDLQLKTSNQYMLSHLEDSIRYLESSLNDIDAIKVIIKGAEK